MSIVKRRILFYSLALIFVVVTPLLLAYSLGYTVNSEKMALEKTGGIFIKSKTPRISIFLDSVLMKETSILSGNALLPDLEAGTHLLRIEKAQYIPWSKKIKISPALVTEFRNIVLVPETIATATSTKTEVALFAPPAASASYVLDAAHNLIHKTGTTKTTVATHINSFADFQDKVFFVNEAGFFAYRDQDGTITTVGHPGFYLSDAPIQFIPSVNGELALIDASGGLFLFDTDGHLTPLSGDVHRAQFDFYGEKLLAQKDNEVEIFWRDDNTYQPFQKKNTREVIFTSTTPIVDAQWFLKDDAHIVVRTKDTVVFAEIDGRGGLNQTEIASGRVEDLRTTSDAANSIFIKLNKVWHTISL